MGAQFGMGDLCHMDRPQPRRKRSFLKHVPTWVQKKLNHQYYCMSKYRSKRWLKQSFKASHANKLAKKQVKTSMDCWWYRFQRLSVRVIHEIFNATITRPVAKWKHDVHVFFHVHMQHCLRLLVDEECRTSGRLIPRWPSVRIDTCKPSQKMWIRWTRRFWA